MDIFVLLTSFLYRIRYKLVLGTIVAVVMTVYFTSFIPKLYNVTTTIFTGITSKATIDSNTGRTDWNTSNNAHDNIINLVKSKSTLEAVSLNLLAQHLVYGDTEKDNKYIQANHYKQLLKIVPEKVLKLVDRNSFEKTVENLKNYRQEERGNFVYDIFNWDNKYYGYLFLNNVRVVRKGVSDMIEISFQCDDPGITTNTLAFLNKELVLRYEDLLLSASNDVVKYFRTKLEEAKASLDSSERELLAFNIENNVINYEEQTKHLAALNNIFESRYEELLLENQSSQALLDTLDERMETRTKLILENEQFLNTLSDISTLSGNIVEAEIFGSDSVKSNVLPRYESTLNNAENKIKQITSNMDGYRYSKEGVAIPEMVDQWLTALIANKRSTAELEVMKKRKEELDTLYAKYTPVGPNLSKQLRNVRVEEVSYLTLHNQLGVAMMRQKNILIDAGTLQVVTPPVFPLITISRKRELYVIGAFLGAIIFISGFYLLVDMFDRTVRDGPHTERLTSCKVIGAIPNDNRRKYRNFNKDVIFISVSHITNILNKFMTPDKPLIVNVLSIEGQEGKSFVAQNMEEYWSERGFVVSYLSYDRDFRQDNKEFMRINGINGIPNVSLKTQKADVIIVEYKALNSAMPPKALLEEAGVNLVVLSAKRTWTMNNKQILDNVRSIIDEQKFFILLNNADREAVEQYTGLLPPYTVSRKLIYRLMNFGLTSNKI